LTVKEALVVARDGALRPLQRHRTRAVGVECHVNAAWARGRAVRGAIPLVAGREVRDVIVDDAVANVLTKGGRVRDRQKPPSFRVPGLCTSEWQADC